MKRGSDLLLTDGNSGRGQRKRLLAVFWLLIMLSWPSAFGQPLQSIDFQALDLEGNAFQGASLQGKVVLLDFWATWCSPCIAAFPTLGKWQKDYGQRGLQVVGIASYSGTPQEVSRFLSSHPVGYTMLVGDEDLTEQFKVIGYPTYFLIGRDGKVFGKYVGDMKFSKDRLLADIEALLGEHYEGHQGHEGEE